MTTCWGLSACCCPGFSAGRYADDVGVKLAAAAQLLCPPVAAAPDLTCPVAACRKTGTGHQGISAKSKRGHLICLPGSSVYRRQDLLCTESNHS